MKALALLLAVVGAVYADTPGQCVCKPQMKLEWSPEASTMPLCNNATMEWLMQTLMVQLSKQEDVVRSQQQELQKLQEELKVRKTTIQQLTDENIQLRKGNTELWDKVEQMTEAQKYVKDQRPRDCADVQRLGAHFNGVYTVFPAGMEDYGIDVYCDVKTLGGGWTVIQRRESGKVNFYQKWKKYEWGFGKLMKEFWLGNIKIHSLTQQRMYELRIELEDFHGNKATAEYDFFAIDGADDKYKLHVGKFVNGTAGDALSHHNGSPFSTMDADNDKSRSGNCAELFGGGWWYVRCYDSNLNGVYMTRHAYDTIVWFQWKNNHTPMKFVEMKIRPIGFK